VALPANLGRRLALGVVFGMLVYAGMVLWGDVGGMRRALAEIPWYLLPAACGLSFLNYTIRFARWERYRTLLGIRLGRGTSFLIYLSGLALTVSPGKMGETFKSWLIRRVDGTPVHRSAPIIVAERFTDLLGFLILVAVGGIASHPEYVWIFWATLGLCAVLLVLAGSRTVERAAVRLVARLPLVGRLAPRVEGAFGSTRVLLAPRELALPTLVSTLGWACECTAFWLLADRLAPDGLPYLFAVFTFALSAVAGAVLIVFPGGLGVTEASMGTLLAGQYVAQGMAREAARASAFSVTILIRLCTLWFAVLVGLAATWLFLRGHAAAPGAEPAAGDLRRGG
jgi:glycosyltransferase 2 family protein